MLEELYNECECLHCHGFHVLCTWFAEMVCARFFYR